MRRTLGKITLIAIMILPGSAQAQPLRPPRATSSISTEIDFDRPGGVYQRGRSPLGANGSIRTALGQCRLGCYRSTQCNAYAVHREGGEAVCEWKSRPPKPVVKKGYVSGRRMPPVRIDDGEPPPGEADPVFGVDTCRRLELTCPGPSELAVVRGSCVCQVKRLNTPIEIGPERR